MADTDFEACLYPGVGTVGVAAAEFAIAMSGNKGRYVAPRRQQPLLASPRHHSAYDWEERATTEEPEDNDSLDYTACLEIRLGRIPKGKRGLEAGCDPRADIPLPVVPGVSFRHFSLDFNDDYCFIVRDLGSRAGTTVIYDQDDEKPRTGVEWIIGGDDFLRDKRRFTIKVNAQLQFLIVVKPFGRNSEAFRAKVDKFRMGSGELEEIFEGVDIRVPTRLPTATQSPTDEDLLVKKKIGNGSFAVVYHVWNARTGRQFACKEPLRKLQSHDLKAWKNEALLMGRVSHPHIVELLASNNGPPPSLELECLGGGSLREHLDARRYFSGVECVHITRQTTSGLAHLHGLDITHRDVSDNNILVERRGPDGIVVKLGDLGMSKEGSELNTIVGTPYYFPPEFFRDRTSNRCRTVEKYTKDVDTWSLGAVLTRLRCGLPRYTDEHDEDGELWCQDIRRRLAKYYKKTRDGLALFLLETMLCMEPERRRNAQDCYDRSLLLRDGGQDTWKTEAAAPHADKGKEEEEVEGANDGNDDNEKSDEEEDDTEAITTRPCDRRHRNGNVPRIFVDCSVDCGTAGMMADPGLDADIYSDSPSSALSEKSAGPATPTPRVFKRSDGPPPQSPPPPSSPSESQGMLDKICDPLGILFDRSDVGDASQFSEDFDSAPGSVTPRPPGPVEDSAQPTKNGASVMASSRKLKPVVPQKRNLELDSFEAAILRLKDFENESQRPLRAEQVSASVWRG
ncbi:hypothetical protein RB599_010963 [Gaeumannomyces hyphopodioides]